MMITEDEITKIFCMAVHIPVDIGTDNPEKEGQPWRS